MKDPGREQDPIEGTVLTVKIGSERCAILVVSVSTSLVFADSAACLDGVTRGINMVKAITGAPLSNPAVNYPHGKHLKMESSRLGALIASLSLYAYVSIYDV